MGLRQILLEGDESLRKVCREVTDFGERTAALMDDLSETMLAANGAGLAAPQVGILRRAVVIIDNDDKVLELINPEVIWQSEEQVGEFEGCLSVPGRRAYLMRPQRVKVRAYNRHGEQFEVELEDIAARAACHETEHLDGKLFIDRADKVYTEEELDELFAEMEESEQQESHAPRKKRRKK